MRWLFLLLCFGSMAGLVAQEISPFSEKLSPSFRTLKASKSGRMEQNFFVLVTDTLLFKKFLVEHRLQQVIVTEYPPASLFVIRTNMALLDSLIIGSRFVRFIDFVRKPVEETVIDGFDLGMNRVNLVHSRFKALNGAGMVVSLKENRPDTNDIDLKGRITLSPSASASMTSHATIMSTIIAGAGNSFHTGKGAAWGSGISSSNFATLLPEPDAEYKMLNVSVQNHSYGTGIENYYGADALAYDASTITNPSLLHIFSAGNSGDKASSVGSYAGINGFGTLTGSFKMAKNILTVGALDHSGNIPLLSSKGPAYDGRIRPELVAFGEDGSSGAAALVSGTSLLLQQAYKERNGAQFPASALIRSVLLNSADDIGPIGIDFTSGFGSLNAFAAMQTVMQNRFFTGAVSNAQLVSHTLRIPANSQRVKITICWNDLPANPNQSLALRNDIDMRLVSPGVGNSWQPWVLNSFPHADSLKLLPIRRRDGLNNVEQITLDNPQPGDYTIEVTGYRIESPLQAYYISYQVDTVDEFRWEFPTRDDVLEGKSANNLRWTSTFAKNTGRLSYSLDSGKNWNIISNDADLRTRGVHWTSPVGFASVIFKMEIDHHQFISDASVISERLVTGVGFNCTDSFAIHWNKYPNTKTYTVFELGRNYLEPIRTLPDTALVLAKSLHPGTHFAIAPNINGQPGMKSYAFNYSTQGIGCFIRNFLVDLVNTSRAEIQLELGTTYGVKTVSIEKLTKTGFVPVQTVGSTSSLVFRYTDLALLQGENTYRSKIALENGSFLYSQNETVYYLPGINYLVYPNPARVYFQIVSKDPDDSQVIVYNSMGQKMFAKQITMPVQRFSVNQLRRGNYFMVIVQKGRKVFRSGLVIQ